MTEKKFVDIKLKLLLGSEVDGLVTLLLSREEILKSETVVKKDYGGIFASMGINPSQMVEQMVKQTQSIAIGANPFSIVNRRDVLKLVLSAEEYKKIGSPSIGSEVIVRCLISSIILDEKIDSIEE